MFVLVRKLQYESGFCIPALLPRGQTAIELYAASLTNRRREQPKTVSVDLTGIWSMKLSTARDTRID